MLTACSAYDAGLLERPDPDGPDTKDGGSAEGNGAGTSGSAGQGGAHGTAGHGGAGGTGGVDQDTCYPNPDTENEVCTQICPEACNGQDDDCDLQIDEGDSAAKSCKLAHANATCDRDKLACAIVACVDGYYDCDQLAPNGCESTLRDDPKNCGACGHVCAVQHGRAACSNGECVAAGCGGGFVDCDGDPLTCETPDTTLTDCGGCNVQCKNVANASPSCETGVCGVAACKAGYGDCDHDPKNGCEQKLNTLEHCGGCNDACELSGTQASCDNDAQLCMAAACELGYGDCDGDAQNGCEPLDGATNCGACGKACSVSALQHVTSADCGSKSCVIICASGWGNCDGNAQTGCETKLDSISHCGSCAACPVPANGIPGCTGGVCGLAGCVQGSGDCSGGAANGCETPLDTLSDCGACGVTCNKASCGGGKCSAVDCSTMPGFADCNGDGVTCETNLTTSLASCGACNHACQFDAGVTAPHGTLACSAQGCAVTCTAGYGDCDGNYANGCEKQLNTLVDCGSCGHGCAIANAMATCASGSCKVSSCNTDYADCDNDGQSCETPLNTPAHCGSCGQSCNFPNAIAGCGGSAGARSCVITGCSQAYLKNCDGMLSNGCEADSRSDVANCGTCGTSCSALPQVMTASCTNSACEITACSAGYGDCTVAPGCETPVNTAQNCGACGNACASALANTATTSCGAGNICKIGSCKTGFGNCDTIESNGCEEALAGNLAHCNTCGNACAFGAGVTAHGSLTCTASGCGVACSAGYADCDGDYTNGCEAALAGNTQHCNSCANTCAFNAGVTPYGTLLCSASGCDVVCDANHDDCDGDYTNGCERNTAVTGPCGTSNPCMGVVCTAQDQCHDPGSCNPLTGMCSQPAKSDGTRCSDGNLCTQTDTCQAGACAAGTAVTCPNADSQCHTAGTCNPATGSCSNAVAKATNAACNDGDATTLDDACINGTCAGTAPCTVDSDCGNSEYCNTGSGLCVAKVAQGAACTAANQCLTSVCTSNACAACTYAGWATSNVAISSSCAGTTSSTCILVADLASAPAATLGCNQTIDTSTLTAASGTLSVCGTSLPYGVRAQLTSGPAVVVFWLKNLTVSAGFKIALIGDKPVVFIIDGAVNIAGTLDASSTTQTIAGAGALAISCAGGNGTSSSSNAGSTGGGGGGFQTAGATGGLGDYDQGTRGAAGAVVSASANLVPLRGGCRGGSGGSGHQKDASSPTSAAGTGGYGGGAVQISASGNIAVTGAISAGGGGGGFAAVPASSSQWSGGGGGGGGSGGAVLLEGASVTGNANVFANGGGGGGGGAGKKGTGSVSSCVTVGTAGGNGAASTTAAAGGLGATTQNTSSCVSNATSPCLNAGDGGKGYTTTSAVTSGQNGEHWEGGAGGGGGGGRIVIGPAHPANTTAPACDDAKGSTADTCSTGFIGCLHTTTASAGARCKDDRNPCSVDAYSGGSCVHTTAAPNTTLCGKSGDACINDLRCTGSSTSCPAASTGYKSSGTSCNDANANTTPDACNASGACVGTVNLCTGVTCSALDQCHVAGTCNASTAQCSQPSKPDTTPCDDANNLTSNDVCTSGVCSGG